ncbi:MAG TPA: lamin tail domain-containing protein, partial [Herpetosiphonaceae bacterium]|nr:lamin tail domain-containing protein [Herpetosiphonaceae bacterium]
MGLALWLIMASVLAALGPQPATPTPEPPTATATPAPSATPMPEPPPAATATHAPSATPTGPPSATAAFSVRINEFFAAPAAGGQEFVEVINLGPGPADLGGWQIDDIASGGSAPRTIPANTIVPPAGLAVINLSNVLNNGGDDVRLLDPSGLEADKVTYAAATAGLSTSRLPDGSGDWLDGTPPTPGALNQLPIVTPTPAPPPTAVPTTTATPTETPAPAAVALNEYLAAPAAAGQEFVEVINLGPAPVDLSGWRLRDAAGNTRAFTLPALLPGQIHALRFASGYLNNGAETIELLAADGAVADSASYASATAGLSTSRLPDGSGPWTSGTAPTPDAPNQPLPPPPAFEVRLNEFLAAPISGTEFIELYNLGPDPAALDGWKIDDVAGGGAAPKAIPAGTVIPPGGFWAFSVSSMLNNAGDELRLLDPSGQAADAFSYTAAIADLSASRLPDGLGAWAAGTPPTPGEPNRPADPPPPAPDFRVVINEFLAAPISGTEFIELYNLGPDPADVGGWKLDDVADGGAAPKAIPAGTVIPPGGFWVLSATSFLNNDSDSISLIAPSGGVSDTVSYTATLAGLSISRLPDGLGEWVAGTPLTPAAPNAAPPPLPPPPVFNVVLNEYFPVPFSGGAEFIELYNLGPDPADVGGWRIDDAAGSGGAPHAIPAGTVIPAGGWWTWYIAGSYLNNAGDELRLLDAAGAMRDSLRYDSAVAGMSASRLPDGSGAWAAGTPPTPDAANRGPDALPTGLFINEFVPHPPKGQPEWIELYSTYTATVDLGGWQLDDVAGGSRPLSIPAGTLIEPGQWAQIILSSNLLNDGGDEVRLLAPDGSVVDSASYGRTRHHNSLSRLPDGAGPWYSGTPLTPNAANQPAPEPPPAAESAPGSAAAPGALLITEVAYDLPADRDENRNEWVEITNPTTATVIVQGWTLRDNKAASPLPGLAVAPGEVVVLAASAELLGFYPAFSGTLALVGSPKLGNGLGNNGDQLLLIDGAGAVIDALSWGDNTSVFDPAAPDAPSGHSLNRQPATRDSDSAADWAGSPSPGPGDLSAGDPPPPDLPAPDAPPTTAAPGDVLISQVMYDPRSPIQEPGGEWLELFNTTAATVTLSGWSIGDSRASDQLPALVLAPNEIALVAASDSVSATYRLTGQVVAMPDGSLGGGLNNGGDALALRDGAGAVIDALSWGDN